MQYRDGSAQAKHRRETLLAGLSALVAGMQGRAIAADPGASFPERDIAGLRHLGAFEAPLPVALGGLGMGSEPEGATALMHALRLLGRGSLSVGRIYEAHVNALRLIVRRGSDAQARLAAHDALAGHLFGLWVTDAADAPVHIAANATLQGAKDPCSAAGHATRALVTARPPDRPDGPQAEQMLVIGVAPGERADISGWDPHGMRATASGRMTLDGLAAPPEAWIGAPGDYLRQPDFSAGAWRTSAVTLGGIEALVAETQRQLVARRRDSDPHQLVRIGELLLAQETARLWVWRAALTGEANDADAGQTIASQTDDHAKDVANTVNLARLAVEAAALDAIRIAQRALGLAAFRRGTLVELLFRDLALYLRQPAPDITLTDAAAHFTGRDLPWCGAEP